MYNLFGNLGAFFPPHSSLPHLFGRHISGSPLSDRQKRENCSAIPPHVQIMTDEAELLFGSFVALPTAVWCLASFRVRLPGIFKPEGKGGGSGGFSDKKRSEIFSILWLAAANNIS